MIETFTVEQGGMRSLVSGSFVSSGEYVAWEPVTHGAQINATNTGVPVGISLSIYTGPSTITVDDTIIENKIINTDLRVMAKNVIVRRCRLNGLIAIDESDADGLYGFLIEDSRIHAGDREVTAVGSKDYTARRCHITGGNRTVYAYHNARVEECHIHGQWVSEVVRTHASGLRISQSSTILRSSITCTAQDVPGIGSGPSANITGYGDFEAVSTVDITDNYFGPTAGGYGCYGGSSASKPYPNANNIHFTGNRWERGPSGVNATYSPITDFDSLAVGNVWSNNAYTDGTFIDSDGGEL